MNFTGTFLLRSKSVPGPFQVRFKSVPCIGGTDNQYKGSLIRWFCLRLMPVIKRRQACLCLENT